MDSLPFTSSSREVTRRACVHYGQCCWRRPHEGCQVLSIMDRLPELARRGDHAARLRPLWTVLLKAACSASSRRRQFPTVCGEIPVRRAISRSLKTENWASPRRARILPRSRPGVRLRLPVCGVPLGCARLELLQILLVRGDLLEAVEKMFLEFCDAFLQALGLLPTAGLLRPLIALHP